MASTRDVKDIMGVATASGAGAPGAMMAPAQQKRPKLPVAKRLTGINREVLALHGDRAPPISIVESSKTFRAKIKRDFRPRRWEFASFTNEARRDDLKLRHWKRQRLDRAPASATGQTGDADAETEEVDGEYRFAKYNLDINVPQYDDGKYDKYLVNRDWSREETDYLMSMVKEYAQKWAIIIDRYQWPPCSVSQMEDELSLARTQDSRTLESLKARYYQVWAKCLEVEHGGQAGMNETEFKLYETLTQYKPEQEFQRKELGWRLFERPIDEIREEEYLLAELQRVMISAQKFEAERAEVRQRLEFPKAKDGTHQPTSFNEVNALFASLSQQDRNRRAGRRLTMDTTGMPTPGLASATTPQTSSHRDSISQKKGSVSVATPIRTLDARAERKFGVTTHDRLSSGVTFRTDKLQKMRQAKSQVQTQKMAAALAELGVPEILQLPTQRVMDAFEKLVLKVQKLAEARKVVEKEEIEARVQGLLRKELQGTEEENPGQDDAVASDVKSAKTEGPGASSPQAEEEEQEEEEEDDGGRPDANDEDVSQFGGREDGEDDDAEGEDDDAEGEEDDELDADADADADAEADGEVGSMDVDEQG